ncbi:MAG: hypothetical protein ACR2NA_03035 [Solirubrobacterales bacterium]
MDPDDPVDALRRWVDHGAEYRILKLTGKRAVVELRTCYGEPIDRLESDDPRLLAHLREHGDHR